MTEYVIKETRVQEGKLRYIAENDEGDRFRGVMTDALPGSNIVLSQDALEDLAKQMIGKKIKLPDGMEWEV